MTAPLRIGDPVQIDETTEVLTLVCLDGEYAWVRDGAGNHITHKMEDLVRARSRAFRTLTGDELRDRQIEQLRQYERAGWRQPWIAAGLMKMGLK